MEGSSRGLDAIDLTISIEFFGDVNISSCSRDGLKLDICMLPLPNEEILSTNSLNVNAFLVWWANISVTWCAAIRFKEDDVFEDDNDEDEDEDEDDDADNDDKDDEDEDEVNEDKNDEDDDDDEDDEDEENRALFL